MEKMGKMKKVLNCLVIVGFLLSAISGAVAAPGNETIPVAKTTTNLKSGIMSAEVSAGSVTISNEYLTMYIYSDGNFRGYTASGEYIFYPSATSDLTIKVGTNEYNISGTLSNYRTKDTYINPNNDKEAITEWDIATTEISSKP